MFTCVFSNKKKQPLYEQLYMLIRRKIEDGELTEGDKLPSKRKLSAHLSVSLSTIENAYTQLMAEGYIYALEKKGYFVSQVERVTPKLHSACAEAAENPQSVKKPVFDLKTNQVNTKNFPFSIWARLMRECLQNERETLLKQSHPQGDYGLRCEIAVYLQEYRNMDISPDRIVLGAGSEYLTGLVAELLPNYDFAMENPGYYKTSLALRNKRVRTHYISIDKEGMRLDGLNALSSGVVHVTPSHHYPLGTVMSINRRMQLLQWAMQREDRYIIEDDYDSEYRFVLKPAPSLQSLDKCGKVIYMNTFSKTLAPSLRIGYMALPRSLLAFYREKMTFYSCTVSEFEQRTLRRFMQGGYYGRHLNRMRTIYKNYRDVFLDSLSPLSDIISISGQEAGTHLLLKVKNGMDENQLIQSAADRGVKVYALSDCYFEQKKDTGSVLAGYAGLEPKDLNQAARLLTEAWS